MIAQTPFGPITYRPGTMDDVVLGELRDDSYRLGSTLLPQNALVMDVGAHIGCFTRQVVKRVPQGQVLAIEQDPDNFTLLQANCGQLPNVTLLRGMAVGARAPKGVRLSDDTRWGTPTGGHEAIWDERPVARPLDVPCYTLAALVERAGWPRIDLLKLDVEGSEIEIVPQAARDGVLARTAFVVMEVHYLSGPEGIANTLRVLSDTHDVELVDNAAGYPEPGMVYARRRRRR